MISMTATASPDFEESLQLLLKLHELTLEDRDESEEADAIRDAMDTPWYRLSEAEAALLRGLSADLYTIGEDRSVSEDATTQAALQTALTQYQAAVEQKNWPRALDVVRENQESIPPDDAAFIRGFCWSCLGKFDVAITFFQEASRLHPLDALREYWFLSSMVLANKAAEALPRARQIVSEHGSPILLLVAATVLSVCADQSMDAKEANKIRREAIEAVKKGLSVAGASPDDEMLRMLRRSALLQMACTYGQLGETSLALDECLKVLHSNPKDLDALALFGYLNYEDYPENDRKEFCIEFKTRQTIGVSAISVVHN